ncbi:hypothetical protein OB2597_05270 [Pseudooceanicola batsensis HTCC2597]|uniref:HhH-GPD domain-containing protein n=1 Tax=Pseudooceanicola batsensis (strain ATCC BAA-863 / DSM 15984 / KCTC 12145 / HTCC2597) TaxID=252305 RepID=A3TSN9_PSEBH|nr:DUF488 domain-containing protein [Pseudooceanicola batsensis]EAQ04666.1 hypothetical protein OB2597_05270 [Pseudooceanicola batsensis HTCC2597]
MSGGFATIGHSNRSPQTVIDMLREAGVRLLIDVRSFPKSRTNPDFNDDSFPQKLADHQIGYRHMLALGGRRPKQPGVDDDLNAFWRVRSFHNYADYALSDDFQQALADLEQLGRDQSLAMMCSEAVWWRCHRRIITDYLLLHGHKVQHLMAPGRIDAARPSEGARLRNDGTVIYRPD